MLFTSMWGTTFFCLIRAKKHKRIMSWWLWLIFCSILGVYFRPNIHDLIWMKFSILFLEKIHAVCIDLFNFQVHWCWERTPPIYSIHFYLWICIWNIIYIIFSLYNLHKIIMDFKTNINLSSVVIFEIYSFIFFFFLMIRNRNFSIEETFLFSNFQ